MRAHAPVGILGGMGPAAGLDFARLFLCSCTEYLQERGIPVTDQAYPPHWLAQLPIADRTAALHDAAVPSPLPALIQGAQQLAELGARCVAIACNTAHAWHADIAAQVPAVELLHIAQATAAHLYAAGHKAAVLLATQGSYRAGLYAKALTDYGIACIEPQAAEKERLMQGIYQGVKAGRLDWAQECFVSVGQALCARYGAVPMLMACTEIPLALPQAAAAQEWQLLDPAALLARQLALRAYGA